MKRLLKISSIFSVILSLIILFYIFYKAQIVNHGLKIDYYLKYYVVSIILLFISLLTFFLTDKVKTHVFLLISFIAFILYVTEFAFVTQNYFSEKNRNRINILKHKNGTGESFDTRIWQDVYRDLKKKILHYFLKLDLIAYRKIII